MPTGQIDLMSVYQPFPLRVESMQYDACFQIGEFDSPNMIKGSGVVVLIPLKTGTDLSGSGAKFIDAFVGKMTSVVVATETTGFQDVSVTGLTNWKVSDILKEDRPFYTWINRDGTRVVVMAEPIIISESSMASIRLSLPITPPADVIHEIGAVRYKASPPDCTLNPEKCKKPRTIVQPAIKQTRGESNQDVLVKILSGLGYFILAVGAVWLAIWFAKGYGADGMKYLGDTLGRSLAAGYGAMRKIPLPTAPALPTRSGIANTLGIGASSASRSGRTPEQIAAADARIQGAKDEHETGKARARAILEARRTRRAAAPKRVMNPLPPEARGTNFEQVNPMRLKQIAADAKKEGTDKFERTNPMRLKQIAADAKKEGTDKFERTNPMRREPPVTPKTQAAASGVGPLNAASPRRFSDSGPKSRAPNVREFSPNMQNIIKQQKARRTPMSAADQAARGINQGGRHRRRRMKTGRQNRS
jgi:hypothetical protein